MGLAVKAVYCSRRHHITRFSATFHVKMFLNHPRRESPQIKEKPFDRVIKVNDVCLLFFFFFLHFS